MTVSIRVPLLDTCRNCDTVHEFVIDIGPMKISICKPCLMAIHTHIHSVLKIESSKLVVDAGNAQLLEEIKVLSQRALNAQESYLFKQGHDNILRLLETHGKA